MRHSITIFFALAIVTVSTGLAIAHGSENEGKTESVDRNYLVKGMTCGGCVFGVKKALKRAGLTQDEIIEVDHKKPDPEHKVGHARVRFAKDQYKGEATDCKIIKEIRDNPGYVAYLDPANTDPCKLGK